jgi:hypothetical protein
VLDGQSRHIIAPTYSAPAPSPGKRAVLFLLLVFGLGIPSL